jgi:hypothetical protein
VRLHSPTCVGLRYGRRGEQLRTFLGARAPRIRFGQRPKLSIRLPNPRRQTRHPAALTPAGAGIFNLLCIDYALRPHLSSRLTLGGRTWPRNPWVYGDRDSHPVYRYSCLHSHWPALHGRFPFRFAALVTLSYHSPRTSPGRIRSFGRSFIANHFRRDIAR